MFNRFLLCGALLCAFLSAACGNKEDEPPANLPAATTATPEPEVAYAQGFFDLEREGANTWRWMTDQGVVRLKNTGKEMKLHLVGEVPVDQVKATPTFKLTFNGETLEQFVSKAALDKEYVIPAAKQGSGTSSELVINVDKSFIPKQFDPKSSDERKLAFSLTRLTWEAK
jgi:hypothetical protein